MTLAATVQVQTLPDGTRQLECWLCANNFSVDLHIPLGSPEDERHLLRAHNAKDGGS